MNLAYIEAFHTAAYAALNPVLSKLPDQSRLQITFHNAFSPDRVASFFSKSPMQRYSNVDFHNYYIPEWNPALKGLDHAGIIAAVCDSMTQIAAAQAILPAIVGEWSLGDAVDCAPWTACLDRTMASALAESDDNDRKWRRQYFEAQVGAYESAGAGWIFWSWKTETSPYWSYQQGVASGFIPVSRLLLSTNGDHY